MQILPAALERIAASEFQTKHIICVLKALELVLQHNSAPAAEITLNYQFDGDVITSDDLIPTITFSLRCPDEKNV